MLKQRAKFPMSLDTLQNPRREIECAIVKLGELRNRARVAKCICPVTTMLGLPPPGFRFGGAGHGCGSVNGGGESDCKWGVQSAGGL